VAPDLSRIDFHDEALYDRICSGDTVGLFQIESRAQIQMLRRTRPRNLEDLGVQVAIVRPGPIVGGAVNPYVRRREMLREAPGYRVPYAHPLLEDALGETLGVIIFQDQVLKVCQDLAGFTDGQAESLRRAMSRKRSKEALAAHWSEFLAGATANGVDETTAREVFAQVTAFSEFGFPKSHATAFALLAYQSAWLRHYHPVEFYVALFNNQPMGFYSLDALGRDARRNGVRTLLPDLNRSAVKCTVEGRDLRIGLGFVRDWGEEIAARVVEERERNGPYRSLVDFLRRTPTALKRPAVENLIWVGGCGALGLTRRELLWQAGLWLGPESDDERSGGREDHAQTELRLDDPYAGLAFPDLGPSDRMIAEYRMLSFSAELHPLTLLEGSLPPGTISSDRLPHLRQGSTVCIAGLVTARQRPQTAKGYVFVLMEDEHGPINVIVKPDIYQRDRSAVRMEPFLTVRGRLQKDGATLNVLAERVEALRIRGTPAPRPAVGAKSTRSYAAHPPAMAVRERSEEVEAFTELQPSLPDTQEYWRDPWPSWDRSATDGTADSDRSTPGAFRYLTALRQSPPGIKSFG
jgi:error-prone DNA polymerase